MTNLISIYNFNKTQIRTQQIDGNVWFCLPDCRSALGLSSNTKSQIRLDEKGVLKTHALTNGGQQETTFINEPNLYRLIFRSNKPQAQAFADWVYAEVLPSIRKTGSYISPAQETLKTLGGLVKRCTTSAIRETEFPLPAKFRTELTDIIEQTLRKVLGDIFYPGINQHPSGMPFGNWAVSAIHAIGAMTSEYDNLKSKQQEVIHLLKDNRPYPKSV